MIIELLQNVALLVTLSVVLQLLAHRLHRPGVPYQLVAGLLFGAVAVVAMLTPLVFAPGVIYDGRSIILSLAGFIGGPVTAVVAAAIAAVVRLYLGGAGAIVGVLVIVQSTAFGVLFFYLRRRNARWESPLWLWTIGLLVQFNMLALQLLLPDRLGWVVLPHIGASVLMLYPLAFVIAALIFLGSERRRVLEVTLSIQNRVLSMIAAGEPLPTTLDALAREIEAQAAGLKAAIMLLDEDGRHLRHAAAPSLPAAYIAELDGITVGEGAGLCGTAVARRRQVVVENIAADPLWNEYRDAALRHGLRAGWSTPIFDDTHQALGAFALYYGAPARPTAFHRSLIDQATHLAAIAITRHRQEEVLRAERDFARQVMDAMGEGLSVADAHGRLTYVNPALAAMLGLASAEMLGRTVTDFAPDEARAALAPLFELRHEGSGASCEVQLRHHSGAAVPVLISGAPYLRKGQFQGTISVVTDLTERNRAEQALRESEARFRLLVDTSPYAIGIVQDHRVVFANRSAATLLGVSEAKALVGVPFDALIVVEELAEARARVARLLNGETGLYPAEYTCLRKDGVRVSVEVIAAPFVFGSRPAVQLLVQDITERKRRRRELEAQALLAQALSETVELDPLLERILEAAMHAVETASKGSLLLADEEGTLHIRAVHGYQDPRVATVRFPKGFGYGARAFRQRASLLIDDVRNDPEIAYTGEIEEAATVQSAIVALLAVGGDPIGVITLDNTERRAAFDDHDLRVLTGIAATAALVLERARLFEEVEVQAQQMAQIMQTAPQGLLLVNSLGRVLMANRVGARDLAILANAQAGDVITHLGDHPLTELLIVPPVGPWNEVHAAGRVFEIIARPVSNSGEPQQWVVLIDDVTRSHQVREQVILQERLATVGQLAAGIAHDFNNILTVILLQAQMMTLSSGLASEDQQRLDVIIGQAQNATHLVRQILDFSRKSMLQRQPIDLLPLLLEQVELLDRTLPETIAVEVTYAEDACWLDADATRLRQVLMNLAINARDAMADGGRLRIGLRRIVVDAEAHAPAPGMGLGDWVCLTVADNGAGIPADVLPHIFDPFFTTKAPGKGTGLGLAQVHGIVAQHDGHVTVDTEIGVGTIFTIYLPALPSDQVFEGAPATTALTMGRGELLLLVEDNSALRLAMVDMLESLNYTVVAAANGLAALELIDQRGSEIALVVSDVIMPDMDGVALVQAVRARGSSLPFVLISGHPLDEEIDALRTLGVHAWLLKPCPLAELAQMLAETLTHDAL